MKPSTTRIGIATLSALALGAWLASAAGPPPPDCGFIEITELPWSITSPGTYCLAGNLTSTSSSEKITVSVDHVVIDLGGHRLNGPTGGVAASGIEGPVSFVEIRNGSLTHWSEAAIDISGSVDIRNVDFEFCGTGVQSGADSVIEDCRFIAMSTAGVFSGAKSRVEDCVVVALDEAVGVSLKRESQLSCVNVSGGTTSLDADEGSRIDDCKARGFSVAGLNVGNASAISNCYLNGLDGLGEPRGAQFGILAGDGCRIIDSTVASAVDIGVRAGINSILRGIIVDEAGDTGIQVDRGSSISDSTSTRCGSESSSTGAGIRAFADVVVDGARTMGNFGMGIQYMEEGGRVVNCTSSRNGLAGISLVGATEARWNHVTDNQGMGIRVAGARSLIQGNVVDANASGIVLQGRRNLVIDNHATDNATDNFVLPWGNAHGPLIDSLYLISDSAPQANFDGPE